MVAAGRLGEGIEVGVLSSSSPLPLADLARELSAFQVKALELYAFRNIDLREFVKCKLLPGSALKERAAPAILAGVGLEELKKIAAHIAQAISADGYRPRISSIATFFPEIASANKRARELAWQALVKVAVLAHELDCTCVEIVAGTRLDRCECNGFGKSEEGCWRIRCYSREQKLSWLVEGLANAIADPECPQDVFFALELETDRYSVINGWRTLIAALNRLEADRRTKGRCGFNADFSHFCISGVDLRKLQSDERLKYLINAHLSDTAGSHVQDLPLGTFHRLLPMGPNVDSLMQEFARALWKRSQVSGSPPFTGSVSIELEFNNLVDWVHNSVRKARFLLASSMGTL